MEFQKNCKKIQPKIVKICKILDKIVCKWYSKSAGRMIVRCWGATRGPFRTEAKRVLVDLTGARFY